MSHFWWLTVKVIKWKTQSETTQILQKLTHSTKISRKTGLVYALRISALYILIRSGGVSIVRAYVRDTSWIDCDLTLNIWLEIGVRSVHFGSSCLCCNQSDCQSYDVRHVNPSGCVTAVIRERIHVRVSHRIFISYKLEVVNVNRSITITAATLSRPSSFLTTYRIDDIDDIETPLYISAFYQ